MTLQTNYRLKVSGFGSLKGVHKTQCTSVFQTIGPCAFAKRER
jgi:hypothetical protein